MNARSALKLQSLVSLMWRTLNSLEVRNLEKKNKEMEDKVIDFEAGSRRANLELINFPENAEGSNVCASLPETLGLSAPKERLRGPTSCFVSSGKGTTRAAASILLPTERTFYSKELLFQNQFTEQRE